MKKKIYTLAELEKIIFLLKKNKKTIALCHGVFDLLHPGHIYHFEQVKQKSDILVVSITADKQVLKGPGKPYFKEKLRLHALASLEIIDYVVLSNEQSAVHVIKKIKPHFYAKGSDYKKSKDDITKKIDLEKNEVKKHGGKILFTQGQTFSSSKIINNDYFYNQEQSEFLKKIKTKYSIRSIINFLDKLNDNIPLVAGETIIDDYVFCKAIGKSGKESYMVMQEKKSEKYLGGVLSIAQNLASLSKKVNLLTAVGSIDSYKKKIERE
jgi:rfaE bifunctional protein nucleotidyltransferase chain/domain